MPSIPIPPGLCQCGCNQPTPICTHTDRKRGAVKGQPERFVRGHTGRLRAAPAEYLADAVRITLPNGAPCLLSLEDADLAAQRWGLTSRGYVRREVTTPTGQSQTILLHRVILERMLGRALQPEEETDHRSGDKLDNRRANLRVATHPQNAKNRTPSANNTSGYRGVYRNRGRGKPWCAQIQVDGKGRHLGLFDTPEEASAAYEQAAAEHFGEWRRETGGSVGCDRLQPSPTQHGD